MKQQVWMISLITALISTLPAAAGSGDPGTRLRPVPRMSVPMTSDKIAVDGRLDDAGWRRAVRAHLVDNQSGRRAARKTSALVIRDGEHLYVGFQCEDDSVSATLTQRDDNLWREECVELFWDPAGDGREYLEIEVNPLGALYDAWVQFGPAIDFDRAKAFDLKGLRVATRIDRRRLDPPVDKAWSCEIAIPLSALPVPLNSAGGRMNFTRIDRVDGIHVYQAWSPTFKWFHVPERFGRVVFR